MPNVSDAVTVTLVSETSTVADSTWGVPVVVGISEGTSGVVGRYSSLSELRTDHDRWNWTTDSDGNVVKTTRKGSTPLSRAAETLFNTGVSYLYAIALPCSDARNPSVTDIANVEDKIAGLAKAGKIDSALLAGVYSDQTDLLVAFGSICDSNKLIYTVCNRPGRTSANILTDCTNYKSKNCFAVAHGDTDFMYTSEHLTGKGEFLGTCDGTNKIASTAEWPVLESPIPVLIAVTTNSSGQETQTTLVPETDYIFYPKQGIFVFDNTELASGETRTLSGSHILPSGTKLYCKYSAEYPYDDMAAAALGTILTHEPWNTLMWRYIPCAVNQYYNPDVVTTLETGDPLVEGTGCVNAVISINGVNYLSDGLTCGGDPKYIDITRTQYYMIAMVKKTLAALRLRSTKLPYTPVGLATVKTAIAGIMDDLVRCGAIYTYSIVMPTYSNISSDDRAARILRNIAISAQLAGDIHTFTVKLTTSV